MKMDYRHVFIVFLHLAKQTTWTNALHLRRVPYAKSIRLKDLMEYGLVFPVKSPLYLANPPTSIIVPPNLKIYENLQQFVDNKCKN